MKSDAIDRARAVDLLGLIGPDVTLRRVSNTRGGEYAGACPLCGTGTDRLRVQPAQGRWWCRHCSPSEHWADPIDWVMRRDHLAFPEAVERLAGGAAAGRSAPRRVDPAAPTPPAAPQRIQPAAWQERAEAFAARCVATLWSSAGERALAYLHGRGLTDATLVAWGVGFHPEATEDPAEAWGRTGPPVRLPKAVTLPWRDRAGAVTGIKLRLATPPQAPKGARRYDAVSGSDFAVYGLEHLGRGGLSWYPELPPARDALLLDEGELDCLTGWQECGDFVDVVTLGGASAVGGGEALRLFARYAYVLVAFDHDPNGAGQRGVARLQARSARVRRVELPPWVAEQGGKDVNDLHTKGGPGALRAWLGDVYLGLLPPCDGDPCVLVDLGHDLDLHEARPGTPGATRGGE